MEGGQREGRGMKGGKRDEGRGEKWREGGVIEGGKRNGGRYEGWREGEQMEGGRGTEGGRASSLFIVLCRRVVLVVPLSCGLVIMPLFHVVLVLSLSRIITCRCRMNLG